MSCLAISFKYKYMYLFQCIYGVRGAATLHDTQVPLETCDERWTYHVSVLLPQPLVKGQ